MEVTAVSVSPVDRSGTITLGGTAQALMPANPGRKGWFLQNNSTGDLWINELGSAAAASQPAVKLVPGASANSDLHGCPVAAISIFGATTAQAFSAREW